MTPEQQVCSLKLAKKLEELGVKQESCFWWVEVYESDYRLDFNIDKDNTASYISAFTAAELLEYLPDVITIDGVTSYKWKIYKSYELNNVFDVKYPFPSNYAGLTIRQLTQSDGNIANALAKTLIYFIEKGYVKAENI